MHMQYNTPSFRRHYKELVKRYLELEPTGVCEPRIHKLCQIIHASNQGVSVFSCEGHECEYPNNGGYVMFAARNRDASSKLLEVLQIAMAKAYAKYGADGMGEIETNIATWGEDFTYPCVVIRSPRFERTELADQWWELITQSTQCQLQHYIAVSPVQQKALAA